MRVVFVVECEVEDEWSYSATSSAARAVMEAVMVQTRLQTQAWVAINSDAERVLDIFRPAQHTKET